MIAELNLHDKASAWCQSNRASSKIHSITCGVRLQAVVASNASDSFFASHSYRWGVVALWGFARAHARLYAPAARTTHSVSQSWWSNMADAGVLAPELYLLSSAGLGPAAASSRGHVETRRVEYEQKDGF
jgi:hypothetical protein